MMYSLGRTGLFYENDYFKDFEGFSATYLKDFVFIKSTKYEKKLWRIP